MLGRAKQATDRGDTLIEVLFAITVFSLVAVAGLSIMNQGAAMAQRSLELTLVRQEIDSQAEALRFLNQAYVSYISSTPTSGPAGNRPAPAFNTAAGQWHAMLAKLTPSAEKFGLTDQGTCPAVPTSSFVVNPRNGLLFTARPSGSPETFSQIRYKSDLTIASVQGLWVEAVRTQKPNEGSYIDFHIRACWSPPAAAVPATIGTIVRLYEP